MNHRNHPENTPTTRCLRHHVWMAYCSDCRDERAPLLRRERQSGTDQR